MNDTHQPPDEFDGAANRPAEHPAEALAELDPAEAPDVAEDLADRLARELEGPAAEDTGSLGPPADPGADPPVAM
jgi:hypothetical protein